MILLNLCRHHSNVELQVCAILEKETRYDTEAKQFQIMETTVEKKTFTATPSGIKK